MTRVLLAMALATLLVGCAMRQPIPLAQEWTAVLLEEDGPRVVRTVPVATIYPYLWFEEPCSSSSLHLARFARASCRTETRVFRFADLDRGKHLAYYREGHRP